MNDNELYDRCLESVLLSKQGDMGSIVKVEVKNEFEYTATNVGNAGLVDVGIHERPRSTDPLAVTHIQAWPKLEFDEVVHEFHSSNNRLKCSTEELNHKVPSTSKHCSIETDCHSDSNGVNISTENAVVQNGYELIKYQNYVHHQSSRYKNEEGTLSSDINISNNFHIPVPAISGNTSNVINSYIKQDIAKFTCKICNKSYAGRDRITGHISSHLGIKPYSCTYADCIKTFFSKEKLTHHIYNMHKTRDRFKCDKCSKTFSKRYLYEEHCNKHNSILPFHCADCGKAFPSKQSLLTHFMDVHNANSEDRSVLCPHCGKVCANHRKLRCHIRTHAEKNFVCEVCNSKFRSRFKLAYHKASHSSERPFKCNQCSKQYSLNMTLQRHIATFHEKKKNFKCSTCGKSFVTGTYLKEHQLKHEGVRKYSCATCGKTFAQASHLAAHQFSHGEKKFECPICGAKFNRHDNMKSHVKRHEKKPKEKE